MARTAPAASVRTLDPIEFRLLGAPAWRTPGGAWRPLFAYEAVVLALLAIEGPRRRDEVALALWPETTARASLRQRIFKLRQRTGHAWFGNGEVLDLTDCTRGDVGRHAHASLEPTSPDDELLATVDESKLTRGAQRCVQQLRKRLLEMRLHDLERDAARRIAMVDPRGAGELLDRARRLAPTDERLWRRSVELMAPSSDFPGAMASYRHLASALRSVGREPEPETEALRARLERAGALPKQLSALPAALRVPAPFVGREHAWSCMQAAWDERRAFVVVGQAGIGKSRLLAEFLADRGDPVIAAAAEGDALAPYGTALRWLMPCQRRWGLPNDPRVRRELARVLPDAGPVPAASSNPVVLQRALVELMRHAAAHGLSILVVDDLHDADAASLRLLQACAHDVPDLRLALATRDVDRGGDGPWQRLVADSAHVVTIALEPLTAPETHELLVRLDLGIPGLESRAGELAAHCGGIPYYLGEVLRDLMLRGTPSAPFGMPSSLGQRLEWQLMRLGDEALALARTAAVAGQDYDLALAARLRSLDVGALGAAWQSLQANHVFTGDRFAHDLVRAAVLGATAPALARELHAQVAADLAARDAAPERVAHHRAQAEDWAAAAAASERAAERAERLGQREDQLRHLDAAEAWYRRAGDVERAWKAALRTLAPSLEQEGIDAAEVRARRLADACGQRALRPMVDAHRARIALWKLDGAAALAFAEAATAGADPADTAARALAAAVGGIAHAWHGDIAAGLATIEPVIADIESIVDPWLRHEVWSGYGIVLANDERWRRLVEVLPLALADARRHGDAAGEADTLASMAVATGSLGDVAAAVTHAGQSDELHASMDNPQGTRVNRINLACNLAALGSYVEALRILEAVLDQARRAGSDGDFYRFMVEDLTAHVYLEVGAFDHVGVLLATDAPAHPPMRRLVRGEVRAYAASLSGDGHAATDLWRRVLAAADAAPVSTTRRSRIGATASAWLPPDEAVTICSHALDVARERDSPVLRQLALLRRAQAHLRCGQAPRARDDIAAMRGTIESVQNIYVPQPESWLTAARVHDALGDGRAVRECLARGRGWLEAAQVRDEDRHGFLERHPVHRDLLAWAHRVLDE